MFCQVWQVTYHCGFGTRWRLSIRVCLYKASQPNHLKFRTRLSHFGQNLDRLSARSPGMWGGEESQRWHFQAFFLVEMAEGWMTESFSELENTNDGLGARKWVQCCICCAWGEDAWPAMACVNLELRRDQSIPSSSSMGTLWLHLDFRIKGTS